MAVFGCSDAIAAADILWQVFIACKEAPAKIETACTRARDIRDVMRVQQQLVETELAHQSFPPLQKTITRHLNSLKQALRDLRVLVEKWKNGNFVSRGLFIGYYMSDVEGLEADLNYHAGIIRDSMISLIAMAQQSQTKQKIQELESKRADAEKQSTTQRLKVDQDLERDKAVLDVLMKEISPERLVAAAVKDDDTTWKSICQELIRADPTLRESDTQTALAKFRKEFSSVAKERQDPKLPNKNSKWPDFEQVLCVDQHCDGQAIVASIAMEVNKLWEVDTTNHWIFNRIEAAGYLVSSKLSESAVAGKVYSHKLKPAGGPISTKAVDTVRTAFKSPWEELRTVLERTEGTKRQGVRMRHFADFEHIICFDKKAETALKTLRAFAQKQLPADAPPLKSKITTLVLSNPEDPDPRRAYLTMQSLVRGFMTSLVNWEEPKAGAPNCDFRSRQFLVEFERREAVLQNTDRIKKMTGCARLRTHWASPTQGWLVTIVGPRDALKWAEALVRAA